MSRLWPMLLVLAGCDNAPASMPLREESVTEVFELRRAELTVVDVGMTRDLARWAGRGSTMELVINGGFFDRGDRPVGLVVSGGEVLSPLALELGGGVLWVRDGVATLSAAESYAEADVDFAIQGRPRLVVDGNSNIGPGGTARAARTTLCIRDGGRRLEVSVSGFDAGGVTLAERAAALVAAGCEAALNLDGGPSSGWARSSGEGRPPDAPIRHAVIFRRR